MLAVEPSKNNKIGFAPPMPFPPNTASSYMLAQHPELLGRRCLLLQFTRPPGG